MLTHPDLRELTALVSLDHNEDFKVILNWLHKSLNEIREANDSTKDETLVRWNQGAAQTLHQFLETSQNSKQSLSKINSLRK